MTNEELDVLCAEKQGWEKYGIWWLFHGRSQYLVGNYHPSTNPAQAMELLKKFKMDLMHDVNNDVWACFQGSMMDPISSADTPERAICMAVVAGASDE